jgi:hypothetical protein
MGEAAAGRRRKRATATKRATTNQAAPEAAAGRPRKRATTTTPQAPSAHLTPDTLVVT